MRILIFDSVIKSEDLLAEFAIDLNSDSFKRKG